MHRWSLKVITLRTHQSPILEARPDGRLTVKVGRNKGVPTILSEDFLKEEDLGLEDFETIVGREVAAVP